MHTQKTTTNETNKIKRMREG
ncbi:Uncharacterized protein APZ42_011664 [Daphnia magna]|uniref:Uncharacterized protein n=1 Tax=Daphnia magna TaxID=35525 RepID=A0A162SVU4_9CRUS|nr:Uncharacterized protein APZ42_011664 [Daphnia magna]